ncbi:DNAJ protein JJJ1 homolog [Rosa chinensis]|uniref:DNAJ protein JJJ1 homolog n=1 Tax=Rosa chinensis TaxID=74649 RepID=UPI000D096BB9|nr:DNAJ protein JJJ1 homolog [Rosa chinensis]
MERRCHYEVLGVDRGCTADEIKSAYRKLALQRHPDKLIPTGVSQADANAQFQELGHAYEVLSDPKERAWYDSHRSQILFADPSAANSVPDSVIPNLFSFFSTTVFSGYSDSGKGFYKVYADVFNKIYSNELSFARKLGLGIDAVREAPALGNLKSDYAQVTAFYGYWLGFCTVMDFCWVDQYDVMAGPNRKVRRLMEEDNKKQRKKAKREYNDTVRGLAEFVKKRDKRVMDMMVKREEERERKKKEERERKKKMDKEKLERAMAYEEPEWAKAVEEEEEGDDEEEEEERKRNELYCVVCGKKFKSEKQWKNHEQSKKHKDKIAEFRESIGDEELDEEEVDDLGDQMREGLEIGEEDDGAGVSAGDDEFYDFGDEILTEKLDDDDEDDNGGGDDDDEMELLQAMAARHKSREKLDADADADDDDGEMELDDEMELLQAMAARHKSREKLYGDGDDDGEMELLKAMAARQKSRENVGEAVGVDDGDSGSEDEMDILEALVAGRKSRKNAASRVEVEDPLVTGVHVDNDSNGVESVPMEYENRKPTRRKGKSKKSGGETKRVDMNEISNGQSEAASENDNSDVKESTSDSMVEMASTNEKQDDQIARKKKSSKQTVEKKKENVKKEANGKSKSSSKGKKAKATSKNSSNACEACGEEFGSRNQLHKHLGDTGHASLKR